ncbi:hypothetical protein WJX77_004868 [Trebouxia sp. C0004]
MLLSICCPPITLHGFLANRLQGFVGGGLRWEADAGGLDTRAGEVCNRKHVTRLAVDMPGRSRCAFEVS